MCVCLLAVCVSFNPWGFFVNCHNWMQWSGMWCATYEYEYEYEYQYEYEYEYEYEYSNRSIMERTPYNIAV